MNDLSVMDFVEIPIIHCTGVVAVVNALSDYDGATFMSDVWNIKDWRSSEG